MPPTSSLGQIRAAALMFLKVFLSSDKRVNTSVSYLAEILC